MATDTAPGVRPTLAALVVLLFSRGPLPLLIRAMQALLGPLGVHPEAARAAIELVAPNAHDAPEGLPGATAEHQVGRTAVPRQAAYLLSSATRIDDDLRAAAGAPPRPPAPPEVPPSASPDPGSAGRHIAAGADERRAAFGQASSDRIARAVQDPWLSRPVDTATLDKALARERTYFAQHLNAERVRTEAARLVDDTARRLATTTLGWRAVMDSHTTPECRAANGNNFEVARPPKIGYPGTLHGGACRCRPGAAFPGQPLVDEVVI